MLSRELRYLASARSTAEKSSRNSREIEICRGSIYLFYSWSISLIAFFRTVSSISIAVRVLNPRLVPNSSQILDKPKCVIGVVRMYLRGSAWTTRPHNDIHGPSLTILISLSNHISRQNPPRARTCRAFRAVRNLLHCSASCGGRACPEPQITSALGVRRSPGNV